MNEEFQMEKIMYIGNTNVYGNVYFSHYFEWQGEAREEYIRKNLSPLELKQLNEFGIRLVTRDASVIFKNEIWLFDEVIIKMNPRNIKKASVDLIFTYFNKKNQVLFATGRQKIVFKDTKRNLIRIPEPLKKLANAILDESCPID